LGLRGFDIVMPHNYYYFFLKKKKKKNLSTNKKFREKDLEPNSNKLEHGKCGIIIKVEGDSRICLDALNIKDSKLGWELFSLIADNLVICLFSSLINSDLPILFEKASMDYLKRFAFMDQPFVT
jgi:hypothetical protein